ncbi:hypothetical protein [Rhodanobacter lindaniclasticus]
MNTCHLKVFHAVSFLLCALAIPSIARADADTDACALLTAAQVGTAVGVPVAAGTHVTPTFTRTCTWQASGANVKYVTLYLQTAAAYDGGKQMSAEMTAAGAGVKTAEVGDDAYFFVAGKQVGLLVRKGDASFKVAVYATLPVAQKETMELALAKEALAKL